jgi:hypothetical protein
MSSLILNTPPSLNKSTQSLLFQVSHNYAPFAHLFIAPPCFNTNLKKLPSCRENNATQKSNKKSMIKTIKEETKENAKGRPKDAQPEPIKRERANPSRDKKQSHSWPF